MRRTVAVSDGFLLQLNDSAGQSRPSVARGLGGVVVRVSMHDQGAIGDIVGAAAQADLVGFIVHDGHATGIGMQTRQVASVLRCMAVLAMGGVSWVEVTACAGAIGAGAVAFFMDVKTMLGVGLETTDLPCHLHHAVFVLQKMHFAGDRAACGGFEFGSGGRVIENACAASQRCGHGQT